MEKETVNFHGKEYETVGSRVHRFRETYPINAGWGINTEVIDAGEVYIVVKAQVVNPEGIVVGTGHAEERRGSSSVNKTSALENAETSAIGRALAACDYHGTEYASADEMVTTSPQCVEDEAYLLDCASMDDLGKRWQEVGKRHNGKEFAFLTGVKDDMKRKLS